MIQELILPSSSPRRRRTSAENISSHHVVVAESSEPQRQRHHRDCHRRRLARRRRNHNTIGHASSSSSALSSAFFLALQCFWLLLLFPFLATTTAQDVKSNVCLMLYQMADNDLEAFLRQDNLELIQSPGIREPNLNTWVYFDHRNYGGSDSDITEPLPMVYERDGSDIPSGTAKPTGSQYLHYDHTLQKMVVDRTLEGEQNGDVPQTLQTFIEVAISDCIIGSTNAADDSSSYATTTTTEFVLILASHGSGWLGFGGDENTRRRRQRRRRMRQRQQRRRSLSQQQPQSNVDVVWAIQSALGNVFPNGPTTMLDVIGFDACSMQAVDTVDDYRDVAKYFLASETVEPGHGM